MEYVLKILKDVIQNTKYKISNELLNYLIMTIDPDVYDIDEHGNLGCDNCTDCENCIMCVNCNNCRGCIACADLHDCRGCILCFNSY